MGSRRKFTKEFKIEVVQQIGVHSIISFTSPIYDTYFKSIFYGKEEINS